MAIRKADGTMVGKPKKRENDVAIGTQSWRRGRSVFFYKGQSGGSPFSIGGMDRTPSRRARIT